MAALSNADRLELWAQFMREPDDDETTSFTKAQLRAALDAADDWVDSNAASYNTALPVAFRSAATARQKARLLQAVIRRRFEVS